MVYGGYEISNNENKMRKYVENALYKELVSMPKWTLAAFGLLKDGDVLKPYDPRIDLLQDLVLNHIQKCPTEFYDAETRHNYKTKEFIWVVKEALNILRISI